MLILMRRAGEEVKVGGDARGKPTLFDARGEPLEITITVCSLDRNRVRIGIDCPRSIPVNRGEIDERIRRENSGEDDEPRERDEEPAGG